MKNQKMRAVGLVVFWLGCSTALKIAVVGGSGFVGSRVCKILVSTGAEVTSLSKSGARPQWASEESWTANVKWTSIDLLGADDAAIDNAMGAPDAVISCVGVVDPDSQVLKDGNGRANANAFASAKRAGIKRAVYVSVGARMSPVLHACI